MTKGIFIAILLPLFYFLVISAFVGLGAISGLIASYWFPIAFARLELLTGFAPYQMGAILAFIGSFFKQTDYKTLKEELSKEY